MLGIFWLEFIYNNGQHCDVANSTRPGNLPNMLDNNNNLSLQTLSFSLFCVKILLEKKIFD